MRRSLRTLPIALAAALTLPSAAVAVTLRAEAVLPPGQSGHISIPGLASGTGSPHLYDQVEPFVNFKWRPFGFDQPGTAETPRAGVTITRDAYGVPSVRAATDLDAWWGVGYAVAQDRMFELELFRRATTGRLSEIVGLGYLQDDYIARRDYYTAQERAQMFAALPAELQRRTEAYRDGINAWISHLRMNPLDMPGEFVATAALPLRDWTIDDSMAIGVFLARTVPSGDGRELDNLRALRELGPKGFDKLLPLVADGTFATVPEKEGRFPSQPGRKARDVRSAFRRSQKFLKDLPLPAKDDPTAVVQPGARPAGVLSLPQLTGHRRGSYMVAVRRRNDGHAFLFNGPQLGYSVPELFVEFELHHPGLDIRGVSAPGVPLVGIGHNNHVAWGFTSGLSDEDDLFAEQLVPGQPEKYLHKGQVRDMECRDETFSWRSPPSDLLGGDVQPESGSVTKRICRTVHGPVQARAGDVAYARQYAIWMKDLESFVGLNRLNAARNVYDVDAAMLEVTWNENVMAADSQGNIGYWHPGNHPLRSKRWDERLPLPGTGEADWSGLIPRRRTPHVINPKQGWLANWNNPASIGWTLGDAEATEKVSGGFHRAAFLGRLAKALAKQPSFEGLQDLVRRAGTHAQQRPLYERTLRRAAKGSKGSARRILDALRAWGGSYHETDGAGTIDPGVAIWEEFKDQAEKLALAKLGVNGKPGDGVASLAGGTGSSHAFDISNGEAYALRTLSAKDVRRAAEATFGVLADRFKTDEIARWREPRRLYDVSSQGAGSVENFPFFDRGTWEQFVEVGSTP